MPLVRIIHFDQSNPDRRKNQQARHCSNSRANTLWDGGEFQQKDGDKIGRENADAPCHGKTPWPSVPGQAAPALRALCSCAGEPSTELEAFLPSKVMSTYRACAESSVHLIFPSCERGAQLTVAVTAESRRGSAVSWSRLVRRSFVPFVKWG